MPGSLEMVVESIRGCCGSEKVESRLSDKKCLG